MAATRRLSLGLKLLKTKHKNLIHSTILVVIEKQSLYVEPKNKRGINKESFLIPDLGFPWENLKY